MTNQELLQKMKEDMEFKSLKVFVERYNTKIGSFN